MNLRFVIREMRPEDYNGKAKVHYMSWRESYRGIVNDEYLDGHMTEKKCREIAARYPENTVVAVSDDKVVGFGCWCPCRDQDAVPNTGELSALYVLEAYKGQGIGRALADYCMEKLSRYETVILWVLAENEPAIGFYRHYGFEMDGSEQFLTLVTPIRCVRMVKKI